MTVEERHICKSKKEKKKEKKKRDRKANSVRLLATIHPFIQRALYPAGILQLQQLFTNLCGERFLSAECRENGHLLVEALREETLKRSVAAPLTS